MLKFGFIAAVAASAAGPVAKIGDTLNNLLTSIEQESSEDVANYRGVYDNAVARHIAIHCPPPLNNNSHQ